jgi:hypothetical protein
LPRASPHPATSGILGNARGRKRNTRKEPRHTPP